MKTVHEIKKLTEGMRVLAENNIATQGNCSIILVSTEYIKELAQALVILHRAGILSEQNREIVSKVPQYARELAEGLVLLSQSNLLNTESISYLLALPSDAKKIARATIYLHEKNILFEENKAIIKNNLEQAITLIRLIIFIKNKYRITREVEQMLNNFEWVNAFSLALHHTLYDFFLPTVNSNIYTVLLQVATIQLMLAQPNKVKEIAEVIAFLFSCKLDQNYYNLLFDEPRYFYRLSQSLNCLFKHALLELENMSQVVRYPLIAAAIRQLEPYPTPIIQSVLVRPAAVEVLLIISSIIKQQPEKQLSNSDRDHVLTAFAEIRKMARVLAQAQRNPNSQLARLSNEVLILIATYSGLNQYLDFKSAYQTATLCFNRPLDYLASQKDNDRAIAELHEQINPQPESSRMR